MASTLKAADRRGLPEVMQSIMLHRPSLLPALPAVAAPHPVHHRRSGPLLDGRDSREAAAQLHHGFSTTIPGGGHVSPLLTQAPLLLEMITEFWRQQPLPGPAPEQFGSPARHTEPGPTTGIG